MSDNASGKCPAEGFGNWDTLEIGYAFETGGRTITEADVVGFACMTGDFNRVHVDQEYAKTTQFSGRIAHGLLILSVMAGLTTQASGYRAITPYLIALRDIHCRFIKPVFIGDTIHGRIEVVGKRASAKPGRGEITFTRAAINQHGDVVLEADFRMLLKRGEQA